MNKCSTCGPDGQCLCPPVRWTPPTIVPDAPPERRHVLQNATDAQLDAIAADYVETMRARGFVMGKPEETACRRAAAIQDAWRCAFERVLPADVRHSDA